MGDLTELAVWVFLLALIAFFTWVRKLVEKAKADGDKPPGKGIGAAVRTQIEKYMRAVEDSPMGRGFGATPAREPERKPPPRPGPPPPAPVAIPAKEAVRGIGPQADFKYVSAAPPLAVTRGRRSAMTFRLTAKSVKEAVILAELLGPPVAERKDYRLF